MRQTVASASHMRLRPSRSTLYVLAIVGAVALQLGVLASIRLVAGGPAGGDLCRDIVAAHRLVTGQDPYARITTCGALFDLPQPPTYLLLIGPFALLPLPLALVAWNLFSLLALAGALALMARELELRPPPLVIALLLALIAVWPPLLGTLLEAQISPILLLLLTLVWRSARRGDGALAGAALGVSGAIRLFPLLAVGYFLLRREWRAVSAAALTFAVTSLIPLPLVGFSGYVTYATHAAPGATRVWIAHEHNVSAWGFVSLLFVGHRTDPALGLAPALVRPVALALIAVGLAVLARRTLARRHLSVAEDQLTFVAYLPAMLLASPLTWMHYFVILLLPLAVLAARVGWIVPSRSGHPGVRRTPLYGAGTSQARGDERARGGLSVVDVAASIDGASSSLQRDEPSNIVGRSGWLAILALALIEVNYLTTLPALPDHLPRIYGPALYALPFYALVMLFAALLVADVPASATST
jgi:hypothetical protein